MKQIMKTNGFAVLASGLLALTTQAANFHVSTSATHHLRAQTISGIGGTASSTTYRLWVSGAQSAIISCGLSTNNANTTNLAHGFLNTVDWRRFVAYSMPSVNQNTATGLVVKLGLSLPLRPESVTRTNVLYYSGLRGFVSNEISYTRQGRDVLITMTGNDAIAAGERVRVSVLASLDDGFGNTNAFLPFVLDFMGRSGPQGGAHTPRTLGGDNGIKYARGMATADFDRDGYPDVAMIDSPGNRRVQVWRNQGADNFLLAASCDFEEAGSISVGDINRDGYPDVLIPRESGTGSSMLLLNNGMGGFSTNQPSLGTAKASVTADMNGDGFLDIVVAGQNAKNIRIYSNNLGVVAGVLSSISLSPHTPNALAIADLDLDGQLDIVVGFAESIAPRAFFGKRGGVTYDNVSLSGAGAIEELAILDLTQDGWPDLVGVGPSGAKAWSNNRSRSFTEAYDDGVNASGVSLADMNGDGLPDLVLARANSTIVIATNNGQAQFTGWKTNAAPNTPIAVVTADFNRDSYADILSAVNGDNNSRLWVHRLPPPPPVVLSATGITPTTFWVGWTTVTNADHYRIEVVKNNTNFDTVFTNYLVAAPNVTWQVSDGNGVVGDTYRYRIRSENGSGVSVYAMTQTVTACNSCVLTNTMGIPLVWIDQYIPGGLGDYEAVVHSDGDADGWLMWEEYVLGTDPTVTASRFAYTVSNAVSSAVIKLTAIPAVMGRMYSVQAATNLVDTAAPWTIYSAELPGNGAALEFMLTNDLPHRVYRMNIRMQP